MWNRDRLGAVCNHTAALRRNTCGRRGVVDGACIYIGLGDRVGACAGAIGGIHVKRYNGARQRRNKRVGQCRVRKSDVPAVLDCDVISKNLAQTSDGGWRNRFGDCQLRRLHGVGCRIGWRRNHLNIAGTKSGVGGSFICHITTINISLSDGINRGTILRSAWHKIWRWCVAINSADLIVNHCDQTGQSG